jgi:hypothetical protein
MNGPKRRVWRCLGHMYVISFRFFIYILTNISTLYIGINYCFKAWGSSRKAAKRRMGPNDARRVVWAICMLIFFRFFIYILTNISTLYIGIDYCFKAWGSSGKAATRRMGPNDTRRIVLAIGMLFFFLHVSMY